MILVGYKKNLLSTLIKNILYWWLRVYSAWVQSYWREKQKTINQFFAIFKGEIIPRLDFIPIPILQFLN